MSKLTDYVTSQDVHGWIQAAYSSGIHVEKFSVETFLEEDNELLVLREVLVRFGFKRGETGALLSFLNGAIRYKNNS